jgi:dihydrolipoamide dehydrogenase
VKKKVKVAIIGAGTAGINAMEEVRKSTGDYALINGGELGTTCARVGCMPSKVLIQVANDYHRRQVFREEGIDGSEALSLDRVKAMNHVRKLRDRFTSGIINNVVKPLGDRFVEGFAEFITPTRIKVEGLELLAERTVIATGSRPVFPDRWHHLKDHILTTDSLFEQQDLPQNIAVIGMGAVGLEMGQALARLGLQVVGLDVLEYIGGLSDPEVNRHARHLFSKEFPLYLGSEADIAKTGDKLEVKAGEKSVIVDKVLLSMGRQPNIEYLHLERLGIELDDDGVPPFDLRTLQIADLPIFIAGDANAHLPVLHETAHEGTVAGFNAVRSEAVAFERRAPLRIAFSDPNICVAGASWDDLKDKSPAVGTNRFDGGREKIMAKDKGLINIYADRKNGELLGAEMVGPGTEHLAHMLAWSVQAKHTVHDMLQFPYYHPTIQETLRAALNDLAEKISRRDNDPLVGFKTQPKRLHH